MKLRVQLLHQKNVSLTECIGEICNGGLQKIRNLIGTLMLISLAERLAYTSSIWQTLGKLNVQRKLSSARQG